MSTINTYLRIHKKGQKSGIIWVNFYVGREKVNFSTRIQCDKSNWSEKKTLVLGGDKEAADKNLIIENIHSRINSVFVKYRLRNRKLTRESFLRSYNRPDDYDTFFEFVEAYRKGGADRMIELSTKKVHDTVMKKLQLRNPTLHFDDIDEDYLNQVYAWLRKDLQNNENTAYKNMATLKKFVRAAWKAGYMDQNPFDNWSIKRGKASYVYLAEDELERLLNAYRNGHFDLKYHRALELFLFMCFSSLHISDARALKLEQFTSDTFTYFRVKNRTRKPEPVMVPVSRTLQSIINNVIGARKKGPIFDNLPADQTLNHYLKQIAKELGIQKEITLKSGRHTFATFFLRKTKDLTALKEILGHSDLRETLIYAHVLDESKKEGIACFDVL